MTPARAQWLALAAAVLFGASTPLMKLISGAATPVALAGLLYLGGGGGLALYRVLRDRAWRASGMTRVQWVWFLGAIGFGGVLGPVLLLFGLRVTDASSAALLLNLEVVLTAVLAWSWFGETAERRTVMGMALIVAGSVALAWPMQEMGSSHWVGLICIAAACLCWALDNNLTRKVASADGLFLGAVKGLVAGTINLVLAQVFAASFPSSDTVVAAVAIGFVGYGLSLALFITALRELGTARTAAYFSTAPFAGAALAIGLLNEVPSVTFWIAAALIALGVALFLTEKHDHEHDHAALYHAHIHVHDIHHEHTHEPGSSEREPHSHAHEHAPLRHRHRHFPDIHHRHPH